MRGELPFRFRSLRARLIASYLVILGIGGLSTSIVGSWIVSSTILREARRSVDRDLATARMVYQQQLKTIQRTVELAASGVTIAHYLSRRDRGSLIAYLEDIRRGAGLDFVGLTSRRGDVLLRVPQSDATTGDLSRLGVLGPALAGRPESATEILPADVLAREDPTLPARAHIRFVPTPHEAPTARTEETSGMALTAAAQVQGDGGVLYGGVLLNRNFAIVDRVSEIVFRSDGFDRQDTGTVTIFQNDVRISTTVRDERGERAVGTRVSAEVEDAVLRRGMTWRGRAFVVHDWYLSSYEPIRDIRGQVIGILYVGFPESAYTSISHGVILSFFAIATVGFILILSVTYYMIRSITQPIAKMVEATRSIAAGRFDEEIEPGGAGEIAQLADSFNSMRHSLRQMKGDLEEWGRTLEEKVRQRTEELGSMQARVAQSERLASLGLLAAGVAHEINNPLGGVLALTALTLEDMKPDDPNRENLAEVVKQAQRCRDIVRGLLDFSRESRISAAPVDVNRILEDTLALITQHSQFFNIAVVKQFSPVLAPVMADKSQLQQVFLNVIVNAVQAMAEKGTLTLSTRTDDGSVEVRIADTGPGIPADQLDRIFDPFFTTKESGRGTGLGLSIAYGIIRKHNGSITVETAPGQGTVVIICLPAAVAQAEETLA